MSEHIIMSAQEKMLLAPLLIGMGVLGALFLFFGLRVLLAKRPVILSNKSLSYLTVLPAFSFFILSFGMQGDFGGAGLMLVLSGILLLLPYRYNVFGINDTNLRESLTIVLNKLSLPFQEDVTGIAIAEKNVKLVLRTSHYGALTVGAEDMSANGLIKRLLRNRSHIAWFDKFAAELKNYYATTPVPTTFLNRLPFCIMYLSMGSLALCASLVFGNIVLHAR